MTPRQRPVVRSGSTRQGQPKAKSEAKGRSEHADRNDGIARMSTVVSHRAPFVLLRAAAAPRLQDRQRFGRHRLPRSLEGCQRAPTPAAVLGYLTGSTALPLDPGTSLAERLFFGVAKPSRPARDRAIFLPGQAISCFFRICLGSLCAPQGHGFAIALLAHPAALPWLGCPHLSSGLPTDSTCSSVCRAGITRQGLQGAPRSTRKIFRNARRKSPRSQRGRSWHAI
jgi:hypothetical protein